MSKKFTPFDKFEKKCGPDGKPLHDTMEESYKGKFKPDEPCDNTCVPYWQRTGNRRCLDIGVVEEEEVDGCSNTRFVRVVDPVVWTNVEGETRCDDSRNRIQQQQTNQCGDTRWVTTQELCCTPQWVPIPEEIDCTQAMERVLEEDGCGSTRLRSTGRPVNWTGTGETRCEPGDIYQIEQTNQCGDTRWFTIPGGCPCIPDWQPSGPERCTGASIEAQEVDGCGHTRWVSTGTPVTWSNTGEVRCSPLDLVQVQQINQCGNLRWTTTEESCAPVEPEEPDVGFGSGVGMAGCYTMAAPGTVQYFIVFESNGRLTEGSSLTQTVSGNRGFWAPAGQTGLYEIMCSATLPDGMSEGVWYPLPRTLMWTATAEEGQSSGRILLTTISIRRIADGLPMATTQLGNIQIGVGVECV